MDAADRSVAQAHQHVHAADPEGNNLLKARAGIKRSAKSTAGKTQNIITANIAGLEENVLVRLSKIETFRKDVRRNRPNNHPPVPDIYDTQFAIPQDYTVDVLRHSSFCMIMGDQIAFFCLARTKVFVSLAVHRAGFWTEHLNQAQFNLCNCTLSTY